MILLVFALLLMGASTGMASELPKEEISTLDFLGKKRYLVWGIDKWNQDAVVYIEPVCGIDEVFDRAYEVQDLLNLQYEPGRIEVVVKPTGEYCWE